VNVKMEPPIESDLIDNHSMNNYVPIEVSEAEDSATQLHLISTSQQATSKMNHPTDMLTSRFELRSVIQCFTNSNTEVPL